MVDFARESKQTEQAVTDIICPRCFKPLAGCSIMSRRKDRYERVLRHYMGWCLGCKVGSEVIQFLRGQKWHIHKHRYYAAALEGGKNIPTNSWQIVNELPEPPAVVIGPGGDFDKAFDPKTVELVKRVIAALKSAKQALEALLKAAGVKEQK